MKKLLFPTMLALSLLTTFLFTSCTKDEPKKALTKTELLCSSPWKLTSLTIDPGLDVGNGVIITDFFAQYEPCSKDDLIKYNTNGQGIYDEGPTKCDPNDPQVTSFTWLFNADETKLIENGNEEYNLIGLNETELTLNQVLNGDEIGGNPFINYTITAKYKH
jgi:hypothetical protein